MLLRNFPHSILIRTFPPFLRFPFLPSLDCCNFYCACRSPSFAFMLIERTHSLLILELFHPCLRRSTSKSNASEENRNSKRWSGDKLFPCLIKERKEIRNLKVSPWFMFGIHFPILIAAWAKRSCRCDKSPFTRFREPHNHLKRL